MMMRWALLLETWPVLGGLLVLGIALLWIGTLATGSRPRWQWSSRALFGWVVLALVVGCLAQWEVWRLVAAERRWMPLLGEHWVVGSLIWVHLGFAAGFYQRLRREIRRRAAGARYKTSWRFILMDDER